MWINLALTVIFDIGLAIVLFQVARKFGASEFVAYLAASVGPLVGMVIGLIRSKKVDGVAIIVLANLLISAAVTFIGGTDGRTLLLKDAVISGAFGLVILISAIPIFPKPLMFFFGLKFGTDGTKEGVALWYHWWDTVPEVRKGHRFINNVWGTTFVVEAGLKVAFAYLLPYNVAFSINHVAPYVALAVLIVWTMQYGKKMQRDGQKRRAAAQAANAHPGHAPHAQYPQQQIVHPMVGAVHPPQRPGAYQQQGPAPQAVQQHPQAYQTQPQPGGYPQQPPSSGS